MANEAQSETLLGLLAREATAAELDALAARLRRSAAAGDRAALDQDHTHALAVCETLERRARRERELRALYETAGDLSSLRDLDRVLVAIVRRARQLLGTDAAYLTLLDETRGDTYMRVTEGIRSPPSPSADANRRGRCRAASRPRFGVGFRTGRYPSIIGPGRGGGGASAYSSAMIEEPASGRPYAVLVPPATVMPLLYIDDAVRSLVDLAAAPASQLSRRTYGIGGFSPTADEIAAAVRTQVPGARVGFDPDPETTAIVESWPQVLSGAAAGADWGWKPRYLLDDTVRDFVSRVRTTRAGGGTVRRHETDSENDTTLSANGCSSARRHGGAVEPR